MNSSCKHSKICVSCHHGKKCNACNQCENVHNNKHNDCYIPCGKPGPQGPKGDPGMPGHPGDRGPQGFQGPVGEAGKMGSQGPMGLQGKQGIPGKDGTDGEPGEVGATGPVGEPGEVGATGPVGATGEKGATGSIDNVEEVICELFNGLTGCTGLDSTIDQVLIKRVNDDQLCVATPFQLLSEAIEDVPECSQNREGCCSCICNCEGCQISLDSTGIFFVNLDATGSADGTSWENGFTGLAEAISSVDTELHEIWIKQGLYVEPEIEINNLNIKIFGGFLGIGEDGSQRNNDPSLTTISGGNVNIIFKIINNSEITIDNLTLSDGNGGDDDDGVAINNSDSQLTVCNSTFSGNNTTGNGGAIYNIGQLIICNSTFIGNSAHNGGTIYNNSNSQLTICNSTFSENSATEDGGAINNSDGQLTICNSTFSGNNATDNGGAIANSSNNPNIDIVTICNSTFSGNSANDGGAIFNNFDNGTMTIYNSTFSGNNATEDGGAIINNPNSTMIVYNSTFSGNSANNGGAIEDFGEIIICNSTFSRNSAVNGGAICNGNDDITICNSTFNENNATNGGAISNFTDEMTICNSTFSENNATRGKEIFNDRIVNLYNSILWTAGETGPIIENDNQSDVLNLFNTIITPNGIIGGIVNGAPKEEDPLFIDPETGNFRLQKESPAINCGSKQDLINLVNDLEVKNPCRKAVLVDLDSYPRIVGEEIDLGAFEFQSDSSFSDKLVVERCGELCKTTPGDLVCDVYNHAVNDLKLEKCGFEMDIDSSQDKILLKQDCDILYTTTPNRLVCNVFEGATECNNITVDQEILVKIGTDGLCTTTFNEMPYSPSNINDWLNPPPTTIANALDRIAIVLSAQDPVLKP